VPVRTGADDGRTIWEAKIGDSVKACEHAAIAASDEAMRILQEGAKLELAATAPLQRLMNHM
jgi:hypothetical protein